jgi:hypothetical protein
MSAIKTRTDLPFSLFQSLLFFYVVSSALKLISTEIHISDSQRAH